MLLIGLVAALLGPRFVRENDRRSNYSDSEHRSDHKRLNNDASVHGFTN
jgi:hypothetical protein